MYDFQIISPSTVEEVIKALKSEEAQVLGGGQTLIPTLKARLAMPEVLVRLSNIKELQGICSDSEGRICIGANTTHAEVAKGAGSFPALADLAGKIGDPAVRNRGTIGGSLANNDPSACYPAAVLATNATIVTDRQEILADDFFEGMFATALDEGEIIKEVRFPVPLAASYQKFIQPASRFALVGVFVARFSDKVRVAVTGAAEDGVIRWTEAEDALETNFAPAAIAGLPVPGGSMIGDMHGTPEYRAHLAKVLTARAVEKS